MGTLRSSRWSLRLGAIVTLEWAGPVHPHPPPRCFYLTTMIAHRPPHPILYPQTNSPGR